MRGGFLIYNKSEASRVSKDKELKEKMEMIAGGKKEWEKGRKGKCGARG